jgi:multiple sugar transport system substrate-binding protein
MARHFIRRRAAVAVGTLATMTLAACSGGGGSTAKPSNVEPTGSYTLKVAYGSEYVFDTAELADRWWKGLGKQFEAAHPKAKVQFIPIPGSYNDIVNKLQLLYRNASTAPDVAELPTALVQPLAAANYLLPLNSYLQTASWWQKIPPVVQSEGTIDGNVDAINHGENTSALYYNKDMFRKAGLPVPWTPKNWQDILSAAMAIKAKVPGVTPLWSAVGASSGANGPLQGFNNLLFGSSTPTIYDAKAKKFVVDSPGLRQGLDFESKVYSQRLGASVSELLSPNSVTAPLKDFKDGKLAIAIGSNYYMGNFTKFVGAPYWADAPKVLGVTPIPKADGTGIATTLGGWDLSVAAKTKVAKPAFDFISLAENPQNAIDAANWAGWVPAPSDYGQDPRFINFATYNDVFAKILPSGTLTPLDPDYATWVEGLNRATGAIAQHPTTTVDQAIDVINKYVSQQLGPDRVETLH